MIIPRKTFAPLILLLGLNSYSALAADYFPCRAGTVWRYIQYYASPGENKSKVKLLMIREVEILQNMMLGGKNVIIRQSRLFDADEKGGQYVSGGHFIGASNEILEKTSDSVTIAADYRMENFIRGAPRAGSPAQRKMLAELALATHDILASYRQTGRWPWGFIETNNEKTATSSNMKDPYIIRPLDYRLLRLPLKENAESKDGEYWVSVARKEDNGILIRASRDVLVVKLARGNNPMVYYYYADGVGLVREASEAHDPNWEFEMKELIGIIPPGSRTKLKSNSL